MRRRFVWFLAAALILPAWAQAGGTDERQSQRALFKQGWTAAGRGDRRQVEAVINALDGYALVPYLEFELLRQRAGAVPTDQMVDFISRHPDWSFTTQLETAWLRQLGRQGRWRELRAHGGDSPDQTVRCYVARASLELGQTDGLMDTARELWLVPQSVPQACDPVFGWWRGNGGLTPGIAWQRFAMAMTAGETGLGGYLRRYMNADDQVWAERWLALARDPAAGFRAATGWPDHPHARAMLTHHLSARASADWESTHDAWRRLEHRFAWDDAQRLAITGRIALFRAVALDDGAMAAIDALAERDQQLLEWRLRVALARGDWQQALNSVEAMAADERERSRWRYWQARALSELGQTQADDHFAALAGEANYYGFLAADRLNRPYPLCTEPLRPDDEIRPRLEADPEIVRALELHHVDLRGHARRTWSRALSRLDSDEIRQAALLAWEAGWTERAIFALGDAGALRAYPWRFPVFERERVESNAQRYGVDPAWVFGLMRAESAMQPDAISPAGARGLLQLMPATANAVARRNALRYGGPGDLLNPAVNIPLGVAHLGELQTRFGGNPLPVAASYNAGIGAVDRWRRERPQNTAPDVWIETLPYYETRDYVSRVLAFATVYDWQLNGRPRSLVARMGMAAGNPDDRVEASCEVES